MKSYRTARGHVRKAMCFYPHKGVPRAVVEAFVVIQGNEILAFGKNGGRVDPMNGGLDEMPKFPAKGQRPIVFSAKTRVVIPSQVKSGIPQWRVDASFMPVTHMYFNFWDGQTRMISLGDTSQSTEAEDGTDSN